MRTPAQQQQQQTVRHLLDTQPQGVLATQHDRQPYTSLMAFAATPDLHRIVFATYRATRKHANLLANPRASLLIDNRTNKPVDYHEAVAISAYGTVNEVEPTRHDEMLQLFMRKHQELRDFVTADDCALLQLEVECYYVVSQFQDVVELRMA